MLGYTSNLRPEREIERKRKKEERGGEQETTTHREKEREPCIVYAQYGF